MSDPNFCHVCGRRLMRAFVHVCDLEEAIKYNVTPLVERIAALEERLSKLESWVRKIDCRVMP